MAQDLVSRFRPWITAVLWLSFAHPAMAETAAISIESTVRFNTDCAHCHEGECSGRLSFHLPAEAADQHIRRHGGNLPGEQVRELYELLRFMKEDCAFYPLPFALALDGAWGTQTLERLRSPSGGTYFLPLGRLSPGAHRMLLQGPGPTARPCIELIDADFETPDRVELEPTEGGWWLTFRTQTAGELFLRVKVQGATGLTRIEIAAEERAP